MAETVTIEIPVSVKDNTSAGLQSAQKTLSGFEKAAQKTEQQLNKLDKAHHISIDADDMASGKIDQVTDKASMLDGASSDVEIGANDNATQAINGAKDAVESFSSSSGSADIGAEDNATPTVSAAKDTVEGFGGVSGSASIGVEDNASSVIDSVRDKAAAWGNSVWTATVNVVDAVTAPVSKIAGVVKNPLAQAGAALGVTVGLGDTIDTYSDFEATMSKVQALSNATEQEMVQLTDKAKEMGAVTKYSGTESAEAFTYMAQAGWSTQSMIDGIGGIMSLAASDGIGLADATDIVANALTAFGLTAQDTARFADVLAIASSATNTDVAGLGEAFKYVAPVAGALKYNIEDVSMALGLMSNNGIKGSMAGTALKTSLANMVSPTDNMAAVMDKYNISMLDSEGNTKSLREVMDNLRDSLGGLDEAEQTAAASTLFGKEAMAGMLSIINTSEDDYRSLAEQIENSAGAADRMAETMQDNLAGTLEQLGGAVETVQLSWGERLEPYISGIAEALAGAMPQLEEIGLAAFDTLDAKAAEVKQKVNAMVNSEEWGDADLAGKVNIAWDTMIVKPFTQWAGSKGKHLLSRGLSSLFSEASKILPGGEEAGLTSWLSAGVIAKGGTKVAEGVGKMVSTLGKISPVAGKFGLAAAGIAAGIAAISVAVDDYNQKQISTSLEDHFGNISLSESDAQEIAGGILNQEYLVNVDLALNEVRNADKLREDAEKALESNDVLEFKSRVGIELTPEEQEEYTGNIETFVESKIEELESRTFAANIHVQTYLGGTEEGQTLAQNIEEWARADYIDLSELSNDLKTQVEDALADGIISVDEEQAISALQEKINSITSRWKAAEAEAKWDWINQEYGHMSAADLESGSFVELLEAMRGQRESAKASVQADAEQWFAELNAMEEAGRITAAENQHYQDMTGWYIRGQEGSELAKSLELGSNTLNETYGDKLEGNSQLLEGSAQEALDSVSAYMESGNYGIIGSELSQRFNNLGDGTGLFGTVTDKDQAALNGLYESMKPDVSAMQSLIDLYREEGQAIPQTLMDAYNEAIQIGAESGDLDASWQNYANQIMENGSEELKSVLTDPNNEMYETVRSQLPEELRQALDRASAETTDETMTLDGLKASVDGVDMDKDEWLSKIQENLGDLGTVTAETEAGIEVTVGEVSVEQGDTLSGIAEAVGMTVDELLAANPQITNPDEITVGMKINIPADQIEINDSEVSEAIQQRTEQAGSNNTVVETEQDVNVKSGNVNTEELVNDTHTKTDEAFNEPYQATGSADVTLEKGSDNIPELYSQVGNAVTAAFATPYSTRASVNVTVDYNIANPTATINTTTNGSTVSASIAPIQGNASGGEVGRHGAELSWVGEEGLEYIIPTVPGRRARGIELWKAAGEALGVLGSPDADYVPAYAAGGVVGGEETKQPIWSVTGEEIQETEDGNGVAQEAGGEGKGQDADGNTFEIQVNLNPTFTIEGGQDDQRILDLIQSRLMALADEIGGEIADNLETVFSNMPKSEGA